MVDGSIGQPGLLHNETVDITIEDGIALAVDGAGAARAIEEQLEQYGREGRNVAELGVGTNGSARLKGNLLEDQKVLGAVHVGFGSNRGIGGTVDVPFHVQGMILKPTLSVGSTVVLKDGRLTL